MSQPKLSREAGPLCALKGKELHFPADEGALRRTGYFATPWHRMSWYVEAIGRVAVDKTDRGDFSGLIEEVLALARARFDYPRPNRPSHKQLNGLIQTVQRALNDLADRGVTMFPPLTRTVYYVNPEVFKSRIPIPLAEKVRGFSSYAPADKSGAYVLVHDFADLLEIFQSSIRRCLHCSRVFLQFRSTARYCDRSCQSVAIMRRKRGNPLHQ